MPEIIFLWLGLLCLGYFVGIARYVGWTSKFPIVWAGLGAGLLLTGILILTENLSKKAELLCCAMGILLLVSVVVVVAVIASVMFLPVEPDLDYLVVLGAQVMGTRPSLSRLFERFLGCSTYEYLTSFRINKAKGLLITDPHLKIQDIARLTGFSSVSHFITMFKRTAGVTPLQFRKLN